MSKAIGGQITLKLILKLIWIGLLIEIIILAIIKPYVTDFVIVSTMAVSLHALYTMALLIAFKNKYYVIFFGAFFARLAVMLWDLYAKHIFVLPNTGHDAVAFYGSALAISQNLDLLNVSIRGEYFAKYNGLLFHWIGPQQMFGHYINVLIGLSVVFIIYEILMMLELKPRVVKLVVLLSAFFPASVLMSAIFLREIVITFFVVCSLYFFIRWFKTGLTIEMLLALAMLYLASIFHSGVIGIFIGYTLIFMFYNQSDKAFRYSSKTIFVLLFLAFIVFFTVTQFNELFLGHFIGRDDEFRDVYSVTDISDRSRVGGSVYLESIFIDGPIDFIIYGPIKAFYFLTAPLPMDWRGSRDIFTFLSDSVLYLGTIYYLIKNIHNLKDKKVLIIGLVLMLISVSLIFGIGTYNAGTAMRHRQKIVPIFLILLALVMDSKQPIAEKVQDWRQSRKALKNGA